MEEKISLRQFLVIIFVSLLSPMVHMTSVITDQIAGRGGWLAYMVVLVLVGILVLLLGWAFRRIPEGGLGALLRLGFGDRLGRVLCGVGAAVLLVRLGIALRFYAERFVSTLYPDTELGMFFAVLLALVVWISGKSFGTLARTGQIFFLAIILVTAVVVAFNLPLIKPYYIWPVWTGDLPKIGWAGFVCMEMLSISFGALFCLSLVGERDNGTALCLKWLAGICVLATVLNVVTTGVFSSKLTPSLQIPFFVLAKEVRIEGALERMESFVAALWVLTDVVFIALLTRTFQIAAGECIQSKRKELSDAAVLVVLPLGYLIAGSAFRLEVFYQSWFMWGEAVCFYLLPVCAVGLGRWRGRL